MSRQSLAAMTVVFESDFFSVLVSGTDFAPGRCLLFGPWRPRWLRGADARWVQEAARMGPRRPVATASRDFLISHLRNKTHGIRTCAVHISHKPVYLLFDCVLCVSGQSRGSVGHTV